VSIFPAIVGALRAENACRPIAGDVLLIGRQKVEFSDLTDTELFQTFPEVRTINALDASRYEGCDIVHDMNIPIPEGLNGIADFIFDGSCLDNIFDPAMAIRGFSRMLRPGGRMMLVEHGTAIQGALVAFSPEWFFDFFAANDYERCRITLFRFDDILRSPWEALPWEPYRDGTMVKATPEIGDFVNVVIAEKGSVSTDDRSPMQGQYRVMHGNDPYRKAWERFKERA
jgi:SAM-dependent methyltransferase